MRSFLRNNGLSLALFTLFVLSWVGQSLTGWRVYNRAQRQRAQPPVSLGAYLHSSHFVEATFENWESEFLGLGCVVLFAVWLRQKGSPDSKSFDEPLGPVERGGSAGPARDITQRNSEQAAPWPVRQGWLVRKLYEHSLSLALFGLFLLCFVLHALGSAQKANEQARERGEREVSVFEHLASAEFWFESFQNWQSEFLSEGAIIVLAIYLRQKGSPQSKPVDAPNSA